MFIVRDRLICVIALCTGLLSGAAASPVDSVEIRFAAEVGAEPFACGRSYSGIGTTGSTITPSDFRFFVSDVSLIRSDGKSVPVTLEQDGTWQYRNIALLDFENGTGPCRNGNAAMNAQVRGTVPRAKYTGIRFALGLPFDLNHGDPTLAPSPLNITSMFWVWKAGYRFLKVDLSSTGQPDKRGEPVSGSRTGERERAVGFPVHLGSAGCVAESMTTPATSCQFPNLATITLEPFDVRHSVVVADLAALLSQTNVDINTANTAPGCMSEPADPDCAAILQAVGLRDGAQQFFHLR